MVDKIENEKVDNCFFTTCVDEKTIICSSDGIFDDYGFPINICKNLSSCEKIKKLNCKLIAKEKEM